MSRYLSDQRTVVDRGGVNSRSTYGVVRGLYFSFNTLGHAADDMLLLAKLNTRTRILGGVIEPESSLGGSAGIQFGIWQSGHVTKIISASVNLTARITFNDTRTYRFTEELEEIPFWYLILTHKGASPPAQNVNVKGVLYIS